MLPALQTQHHETVEGGNYAMSLCAIQVLHSHAYGVQEARCWPPESSAALALVDPREAMWEVKGQRAGFPLSVGVCIGQGTRASESPRKHGISPRGAVVEARL